MDGIKLGASERDHVILAADGEGIQFKTTSAERPDIKLAFDGKKSDYLFEVRGVDLAGGDELDLSIDAATGKLKVFDSGKGEDKYGLRIDRFTSKGKEEFIKNDIALESGDAEFIDFEAWLGDGKPMTIEIDKGNNGSIDSKESEPDEPALK